MNKIDWCALITLFGGLTIFFVLRFGFGFGE